MNPSNTPSLPASPHLLLVDDDRLILATMARGLREAGYRVSTADSVDDVETLLASGMRPDLVILDVHLPGRGGLEWVERLRDLDRIPFVMLSAYSDPETVARAAHSGALGYMVKPLDIFQIRPTIEAALQRARELDGLRQIRAQLQAALDGDRDINVATGIAMAQHRLRRAQAFELLRAASRTQRIKLSALAAKAIDAHEALLPP
ncbi:response regulator [Acidovorax sp. SRB_14]|uniref:ANTAR domain-containing response regulator n=1 Tax=unclassified Acidovorax TaxID=2684926 RepID=UPI00145D9912|nr:MULTISPECIES: response regulator [unclassified Acidovorax]NMM76036.1 response regulator [Acidovorax sp. SRB_24]NMM81514.1 response regulator [Acidovorax sp. SRB_14]NMM90207.1 response regulator [Rhodococcus sp. SRB_17]